MSAPSHATDAELELLRLRARRYAQAPPAALGAGVDCLLFARGATRYALPLRVLVEVRRLERLCRVPGTRPAVLGVFHHRGAVVSAHDLSCLLGEASGSADPPWVVLVQCGDDVIGLAADELAGAHLIRDQDLRPLPVTLGDQALGEQALGDQALGDRAACFRGMTTDGTLLLQPAVLLATPAFLEAF